MTTNPSAAARPTVVVPRPPFEAAGPIARAALALTDWAERWVPDAYSCQPGARLYRTGDLARYQRNCNILFVGRADHQVKIRGFRIELGEIESVLSKHAGVQQAAVLARTDERGDKSLVAYAVGNAGAEELRIYLRSQLPEYMVPSSILILAKLPLNANGKIDRAALPKPEDVRGDSKEPVAPRAGYGSLWDLAASLF